MRKLKTNQGISGSSETVFADIENNSICAATLHTTGSNLKKIKIIGPL